jgi:hypothetical protein
MLPRPFTLSHSLPLPVRPSAERATLHGLLSPSWVATHAPLTFHFSTVVVGLWLYLVTAILHSLRQRAERWNPPHRTGGYSRADAGDLVTAAIPLVWSVATLVHASEAEFNLAEGTACTEYAVAVCGRQRAQGPYLPPDLVASWSGHPARPRQAARPPLGQLAPELAWASSPGAHSSLRALLAAPSFAWTSSALSPLGGGTLCNTPCTTTFQQGLLGADLEAVHALMPQPQQPVLWRRGVLACAAPTRVGATPSGGAPKLPAPWRVRLSRNFFTAHRLLDSFGLYSTPPLCYVRPLFNYAAVAAWNCFTTHDRQIALDYLAPIGCPSTSQLSSAHMYACQVSCDPAVRRGLLGVGAPAETRLGTYLTLDTGAPLSNRT